MGGKSTGSKGKRNEKAEVCEYMWSLADKEAVERQVWRCELPAGRPALDFFAGVASLDVRASENEAVLVAAGVWCRKERNNKFQLESATWNYII